MGKMSQVLTLAEFLTFVPKPEKSLQDMPDEILFEIFRRLSKGKLFEITKLCSKISDVAWDARLWKNVYIKYEPIAQKYAADVAWDARLWKNVYIKYKPIAQKYAADVAFEELYSKPWPVKVIDLSGTKIYPPVSSQINQVVKVTKLDLSSIYAVDKVTLEAILVKYQCTELYLNYYDRVDLQGHIMISPDAFSKQTSLEVLSMKGLNCRTSDVETRNTSLSRCHLWLKQVLSNCKNLRSLDLGNSYLNLTNIDMLINLVEHLPTSLETLRLEDLSPNNFFFKLLLERIPNLRELELGCKNLTSIILTSLPSLRKFQFLEALHFSSAYYEDINKFSRYLTLFPALKRVIYQDVYQEPHKIQKLRTTLEPHGIIVEVTEEFEYPYLGDCHLWEVSNAV